MPPIRPNPGGAPGGGDPASQLAQLQLQRAQLAASMPTDAEFEALISAQANSQRVSRTYQQTQLDALDAAIAELEAAVGS